MSSIFEINNYSVKILETQQVILYKANLNLGKGEILVLIGKNGVGKSSFAMSLLNIDGFEKEGSVRLNKVSLNDLNIEEVARNRLFVSFQSPPEIEGVSLYNFIQRSFRSIYPDDKISTFRLRKKIINALESVGLNTSFAERNLNQGFSGGEKRKSEFAQMIILEPLVAVLDEVDSGLDIDSTKTVAELINKLAKDFRISFIIISHNLDFINKVNPDRIVELKEGKFIERKINEISGTINE
jgi:Fe-S cluster assembly ATP-binding protein